MSQILQKITNSKRVSKKHCILWQGIIWASNGRTTLSGSCSNLSGPSGSEQAPRINDEFFLSHLRRCGAEHSPTKTTIDAKQSSVDHRLCITLSAYWTTTAPADRCTAGQVAWRFVRTIFMNFTIKFAGRGGGGGCGTSYFQLMCLVPSKGNKIVSHDHITTLATFSWSFGRI